MAIVTLAGGVAAASGSIAGTTFSRNRGGPYIRVRSIPTNPNTIQQQAVRSAVSTLTSRWTSTLTPAEREAWDTYAFNVPLPNALGEPRNVGGLGMYVRSNVPRIQASLLIVDDAPTTFNLGEYTPPSITSVVAAGTLTLAFDALDTWANEDDSAMLLFGARPQNPAVNFFKGPYRAIDPILGDLATPPTSPHTATMPFSLVAGQRAFIRAIVTRVDGRLSSDFRTHSAVT